MSEDQYTVVCSLGGKFVVDRVLGASLTAQRWHPNHQKVKAASALFVDAVINGDSDAITG